MNLRRIIKFFYIGYTFYILMVISTTSINLYTILPSIIIMWINYFLFSAGYKLHIKKNKSSCITNIVTTNDRGWLNKRSKKSLLLIALAAIIFSIFAVNYYTGQTPISTFRNLTSNVSLYYEYQTYFKEQQRNMFSIAKAPFIFMLFYIKFITFYSYISVFLSKKRVERFDVFYIIIITLSFLYIGIARGTNFEFFEFVMLIIFIILLKKDATKYKIPFKTISSVITIISIMIFVFYSGISARGVNFNFNISKDVFYNPNGIIPSISGFISFVIIILYSYFGFGFYYMSTYVSELWITSFSSFVSGLIPFGYLINSKEPLHNKMRNMVDMGARWQPDSAAFINNYGYLGLLIICFILGAFSKIIQDDKNKGPTSQLTSFIILLQMISLPVGNFVTTSSASQLIVALLFFYWIWKVFIRLRIKL